MIQPLNWCVVLKRQDIKQWFWLLIWPTSERNDTERTFETIKREFRKLSICMKMICYALYFRRFPNFKNDFKIKQILDGPGSLDKRVSAIFNTRISWSHIKRLTEFTKLPVSCIISFHSNECMYLFGICFLWPILYSKIKFFSFYVKVIVKGIMHPDDAVNAIKFGASGIFASNSGGRTLDNAAATVFFLICLKHHILGSWVWHPILINYMMLLSMEQFWIMN